MPNCRRNSRLQVGVSRSNASSTLATWPACYRATVATVAGRPASLHRVCRPLRLPGRARVEKGDVREVEAHAVLSPENQALADGSNFVDVLDACTVVASSQPPAPMAKNSKIEWTHHTFNPWWGCTRVSPACRHCYAEALAHRFGLDVWGKGSERRLLSDTYWRQPLAWNRQAEASRTRARVFCASMADVFEDLRQLDPVRDRLWALIAKTPHLDWLLLTKRPEVVGRLVPWREAWPTNVWLGTTIENQKWADRRAPALLQYPAAVRFVSCEPLLGPVDLSPWLSDERSRSINWVIAGGESGHHARPSNPEWFQSLRDQCRAHAVAFHFKQWGNWKPIGADQVNGHKSRVLRSVEGQPIHLVNIGKKAAGRDLEGRRWDQLPRI